MPGMGRCNAHDSIVKQAAEACAMSKVTEERVNILEKDTEEVLRGKDSLKSRLV